MSRIESAGVAVLGFAVAFGVFTVLFATAPSWGGEVALNSLPVPSTLVTRIVVDKTTYYVGQDVTILYEYYNPYLENVTFSPPFQLLLHVEYAGEKNDIDTVINLSWVFRDYVLGPGESFPCYRDEITAEKPGNMTITINGLSKTVTVLQREP